MFVHVLQGKVRDGDGLRAQLDAGLRRASSVDGRAASERLLSMMQMERFMDLSDPWLYSG